MQGAPCTLEVAVLDCAFTPWVYSYLSIQAGIRIHSITMFRRLVAFILTLCMCWQSLAYAGAGVVMAQTDDHEHALMHFEGTSHHHDEHGGADGWHQDESAASTGHLSADACVFPPALVFLPTIELQAPVSMQPESVLQAFLPLPFLDGLERPPRLTA
ncbi:hypothetical protein [Roseateles microcysteis]|uniref:hypothetical protein n=1 Tax=Roseateles microcysteis TaxID=3119057 RepID=UPI002FE5D1B1